MTDVIINKSTGEIAINGPFHTRTYIFRSFSKNNNGIVPTYVFHVNDDKLRNIKITLPQCNTVVTEIPNK